MMNLLKKGFLFLTLAYAPQLFAQTYADGLAAMQMDQWDKAIEILTKFTEANPQDQDALLSLGSVYTVKGETDKAMAIYEKAFQANSESAKAHIVNARVAMFRNDMTTFDKEIERATRYGKKDATVFRFVGESFLYSAPGAKPNYTRAFDYLKKSYDINSRDFNTLMSIGYNFKDQGNGGQAAQYYEYASLQQPKNPLPLYMLGRVYKIAKIPQKSVEYFNKAIAVAPNYTPALRAKADYYYFEERNYEEAVKAYKDLVTFSDNVEIEDELQYANTLFLTRDYQGCIAQVEKVIKQDPSKTYLRRLLGYSYYETGEFQKGLDVMENYFKVVESDKVLPSDYLYFGNLQLKAGKDTTIAIQNLNKVIEMDPTRWELYKEIGDLNYKQRDMCAAAQAYSIRLDSAEATEATIQPLDYYYQGLSWYYCEDSTSLANYEKALAAFVKVSEKAPTSGIGWFWAGRAASRLEPDLVADTTQAALDAFGKAHDYFEEYIKIGEKDPAKEKRNLITAYQYLTYYHFVKKEDASALDFAEKLLALDPEDATAIGIRDAIQQQSGVKPAPPAKGGGPKN